MLQARATGELCRLKFTDVIHGMRTVEELEDMVDEDHVVDQAAIAAAPAQTRTTVRRQRTQPAAAEAPAADQPPAEPQATAAAAAAHTRR